jgi:hypothetical protein
MLIGHEVLKFCSTKTRGVITAYEEVYPTENGKFLRSADELFLLMMARHGLPIYRRTIHTHWSKAKYRSLHVPFPDRHEIYFAQGLPPDHLRYLKTKELFQIELWQAALATTDIVELVRDMILRSTPASVDLGLGYPATSDTLGEIAAGEFLFPTAERLALLKSGKPEDDGIASLADEYEIPQFVVQGALNNAELLKELFA